MSMIFDWLLREGWIIAGWWLVISAMGFTVFPALVRLLPALTDKGYTLARPAGLLFVALVFWLLAVLGFINNTSGGILLAWVIVLLASAALYSRLSAPFDLRDWWRDNRLLIITTEILFIVLLVGFAAFRAHQNGFVHTEQPMDLAFMSAIQHSETFPPNDPWLAGYAISYYYFGYLMAAMNATLVGVPSTIGYNMHLALLFALVGTASVGLVYNLVRGRARNAPSTAPRRRVAVGFGLLGMAFLLLMSNFHMIFVELPYRNALFSDGYYQFWDTKNRTAVPDEPSDITRAFWWWFDHSRTVTERTVPMRIPAGVTYQQDGQAVTATEAITTPTRQTHEVIDEFPAFSFLLGDSHPHVMALPFVLLALGLALNVLLSDRPPDALRIAFYGVCIGALIFLNTWDAPVYVVVIVGAEAVRRVLRGSASGRGASLRRDDILFLFGMGAALLAVMLLVYMPFLVGFTSQLGGVLANVAHPTRPQQLFLMFGPFVILLAVFLAVEWWRGRRAMNWALAVPAVTGIIGVLFFLLLILMALGMADPTYQNMIRTVFRQEVDGMRTAWDVLTPALIARRLSAIVTLIVIVAVLLIGLARLFPPHHGIEPTAGDQPQPIYTPSSGFALLLIVCGVGLILIPEFVYLRDNFQTRMNTIFKFYYQAWALFSISAAYGVYSIVLDESRPRPRSALRIAYGALTVLILGAGMVYFVLGTYSRALHETGIANNPDHALTLDGGAGFVAPEDYQAIMCLREVVGRRQVVVAEANPQGGRVNYNPAHGRVGSLIGTPIILGWPGHQSQWRGTSYREVLGTRPADLDLLFTAERLDMAQPVIERYGIDYILYGNTERLHYGSAGESKFLDHFEIVCEAQGASGTARIFRVSRPAGEFATLSDGR
ncbi:MAG: hypothetical protein EA396_15015 [Anaerolineaceae bacterium]|nr:MAG: hypothetical protein EA396_15015 [Anaerolineaceae bacterium]